jgi:hypothetical protein
MKKASVSVLLLILVIFSVSCWNEKKINEMVANVYNNKTELNRFFEETEITKRGDIYFLELYDENDSTYWFRYTGFNPDKYKKLQLLDTINEKKMIFLCRKFKVKDTTVIKEYLLQYTFRLFTIMDNLHIKSALCRFEKQGITNLFFISAEDVVMYISDPNLVTNAEWKEQIQKAKKLDNNWYYYSIQK